MMLSHRAMAVVIFAAGLLGLAQAQQPDSHTASIDELWIEPVDLEKRDLFRGPPEGPPPPAAGDSFAFVARDTSGRSPGYDVRDRQGVVWSVKLGPEAQAEVVSSRILWAIGFHQPPAYYLESWTMTGQEAGPQTAGRFRPEIEAWKAVGDWEWAEYPHARSPENGGLLVAQMILNNWDLKTSNNKIIERSSSRSGPRRLYVARDLGASLGSNEQAKWLRWTQLRMSQGTKNDLPGFEESGFIDGVEDGFVKFSYSGPNKPIVSRIMPSHVRWAAGLLSRLSDAQWHDAFRAGGYSQEDATRFIAKIKEKIAVGMALESR
jgi:hypothetical protein